MVERDGPPSAAGISADVAAPERARAAGHEMRDPVLRRRPLVEMFVPRESDVDAVADEDRLEPPPQFRGVRAIPAGRVDRMVKQRDLPVRFRAAQLVVEPSELLVVEMDGVQYENLASPAPMTPIRFANV